MSLVKETPEVRSWIYDTLEESRLRLPRLEGFSVREKRVTALFERLKSSIDVENWSEEDIGDWLNNKDVEDSIDRLILAANLGVPLYIVLWCDEVQKFRVLSVRIVKGEGKVFTKDEKLFKSLDEFAQWLATLKGMQVSKKYREKERLSAVDNWLRKKKIPWPGNLDGFLVNRKKEKVLALFEVRRTRVKSVRKHELNDFFYDDMQGWVALDILRKQLDVPLYIITWSSDETLLKIQKLLRVTNTGLDRGEEVFIDEGKVVRWFLQSIWKEQ
ncbi:MAG: hypothetical protein WED05_05720 [Candidatus Atabeyarchaeum deiterrae]